MQYTIRSITAPGHDALGQLEFATVRSHADTLRILHLLGLQQRVRLTAATIEGELAAQRTRLTAWAAAHPELAAEVEAVGKR